MARYIKANPKVVSYLHLENDRNKLKDGNYILWLQDMLPFGPLPRLAETLERIGAIAILPHEAREEQYGTNLRPLPTATDPDFVVETAAATEPEAGAPAGETGETPANDEADGDDTTEAPAEETPESNDETGESETDTDTNDKEE